MRRGWLIVCAAIAMVLALAGCGLGGQRHAVVIPSDAVPSGLLAPPEPSPPQSTVQVPTSTIYLVNNTNLVAVHRPRTQTATLHGLIDSLLKGPTDVESSAGFGTAINTSPALLGTSVDSSEVATINLSGSFGDIRGSEQVLATAQIVMTAVSFPGVTAVQISLDGVPTAVPLADGTLAGGPLRASDYASLLAGASPKS
ncbi:MAG: GerMN domain-containing protein [Acidothermaceae bacterium]